MAEIRRVLTLGACRASRRGGRGIVEWVLANSTWLEGALDVRRLRSRVDPDLRKLVDVEVQQVVDFGGIGGRRTGNGGLGGKRGVRSGRKAKRNPLGLGRLAGGWGSTPPPRHQKAITTSASTVPIRNPIDSASQLYAPAYPIAGDTSLFVGKSRTTLTTRTDV